ncbi:MAG TPA: hypothetical protein VGC87_02215 [Pyrinomonadaceae bacterium]|jgi:uncharacterized protein (DUF3084 family)
MPDKLRKLPFDERNEQDFEDLTRKIQDGIAKLRRTRSLPATQEKLAEMVGCSRKTLHNRGWPITELKKINEERKANKENKQKNTTAEHRLSAEKHIAREKRLIGQIRNLQQQNSKLFDEKQELEEQKAALTDTVRVLEEEIDILKDEKRKLERESRKFKQGCGRANVVNIRAVGKAKKAKEGKK